MEKFLQERDKVLGDSTLFSPRCGCMTYEHSAVPLVVVLTKVDRLDMQLEIDLPENEILEDYKSRTLNERCVGPLRRAAGSNITHVAVSGASAWYRGLLMRGF